MFTTLKNAFKIKEIRMKLLFTFCMLVVIRFGSQLPVPGVNREYFASWFEQQTGGAFNFFDGFFLKNVCICVKYNTLYYFINHYAAFNNCYSKVRRDAERW